MSKLVSGMTQHSKIRVIQDHSSGQLALEEAAGGKGLLLPDDLVDALNALKRHNAVYTTCLDLIKSCESSKASEVVQLLRGEIDNHEKSQWDLVSEPFVYRPYESETRTFRYVCNSQLEAIGAFEGDECAVCGQPSAVMFRVWIYPEQRDLCAGCIANGLVPSRFSVEFHPTKDYYGNPEARFYQVFQLAYCTPPISSFCKGQEPYRWARHCGDFGVYVGDVSLAEISGEMRKEMIEGEGGSYVGYLADPDLDWGIVHKFRCMRCGEDLYSFDYEI